MSHLPRGWIEYPLKDCVTVFDSRRVPVNSDERANRQGDVPYYGATGQVGWIDDYLFDEELLLIGEDGAPFLDKTKPIAYIIRGKSWVNNHAHVLRAHPNVTSNLYLKFFLDYFDFHEYVNGTTRLKLTQGSMNSIPVRLAPFNEQCRIVAKLEKLLSRVNATQERLGNIPRILKRFRQSVLAAACSGTLTVDWRNEHPKAELGNLDRADELRKESILAANREAGFARFRYKTAARIDLGHKTKGIDELFPLPVGWQWASLGQLTWSVSDGPHFSPKYVREDQGVPFISGRNISYEGIDFSDAKYVSKEDHKEFSKRTQPRPGDVLLTKGGTTGIATVVPKVKEFSIWVHVALLKVVNELVTPFYLRDVLSAPFVYLQSQAQTHGVGNQDLGLTRMVHMAVPLPPLAEQHEIVRRVETLFKTADALEAHYHKAKAHVDKLTQSILAKAFRGELAPQDPTDEPAFKFAGATSPKNRRASKVASSSRSC
jgi:type I restriction enzyme S subunit